MKVKQAWLDSSWQDGIELELLSNALGKDRIAIPGMPNVHSHAFQRALAGLAEYKTASQDSFWTWRKQMYAFLNTLTPDDCYSIASQLYCELLENGFTSVGEFHYLHNAPGGNRYSTLTEMSDVLIQAALDTGIRIVLLPVLYQRGGFHDEALDQAQQRFELSSEEFCQMITSLESKYRDHDLVDIGIAFHSLRAVSVESMLNVIESLKPFSDRCPIHVHLAEQLAEVEACLKAHRQRPVEFCLDHLPVGDRWCMIHSTHMVEKEVEALAKTTAVAGLCPMTEANLGDGIFPARTFLEKEGRISIGTDSHVCTQPWSELRMLEYGQRLSLLERTIIGNHQSNGRTLFESTRLGGNQAIHGCATPSNVDWVLLDSNHVSLIGKSGDRIFDSLVFCEHGSPVSEVFVKDQMLVIQGQHINHSTINRRYRATISKLLSSSKN